MHVATVFPNSLVSVDWLREHQSDANLRILDASFFLPSEGRNAQAEFAAAHIPGARFFDIDAVADHSVPLPHMLPTTTDFAAAAGALGISNDTWVVVYDNNGFMASARVWWTFRCFGHERVAVLDGGLSRWRDLGQPVAAGAPVAAPPAAFSATFHPGLVRNLEQIREALREGNVQLADARSPGRFAGSEPEPRAGLRSGHIPGSRNLFFRNLVDPATQCLKPAAELARAFADAHIDPGRPVVATCGTGVTAAILALGLYRLGNEYAAVYDGSWTEWGGREDTEVATGN